MEGSLGERGPDGKQEAEQICQRPEDTFPPVSCAPRRFLAASELKTTIPFHLDASGKTLHPLRLQSSTPLSPPPPPPSPPPLSPLSIFVECVVVKQQ